jgi:26S proteasome regulatory subunit N8
LYSTHFDLQVLCIIEVSPKKNELPTEAYIAVEEIRDDGTPVRATFEHVPSSMGAEEAEEVGVEHLLRFVKKIFFNKFMNCILSILH